MLALKKNLSILALPLIFNIRNECWRLLTCLLSYLLCKLYNLPPLTYYYYILIWPICNFFLIYPCIQEINATQSWHIFLYNVLLNFFSNYVKIFVIFKIIIYFRTILSTFSVSGMPSLFKRILEDSLYNSWNRLK